MDKEQYIQDYLANKLSASERQEFKNLLSKDPDFQFLHQEHEDMAAAFHVLEAQQLKQQLKTLESQIEKEETSSFSKFKYAYLAIASLVVVGMCYNLLVKDFNEDLYESNFEIYPNTYQPITRSNTTNNDNAFVAYENKNYATAEKEFEQLLKTSDNPNLRFYYAASLLNQSKFDQAQMELEKLKTLNFDYRDEALWYLALIYIKKEDYKNAKLELFELDHRDSAFKKTERQLILKKLKTKS